MSLARALTSAMLVAAAACGTASSSTGGIDTATSVRLGYFANLTHAVPLVGVAEGLFADALGDVALETQVFNAGPSAVEAIFAGAIDLAYVGPNPAINAYTRSAGEAVRVIAGASSGGAALVVQPGRGIDRPEDLRGRRLATPQLGGTQDVALRSWLADHALATRAAGSGGDVTVEPTDNATALDLFQAGEIDGAWVPEPWASRLVLEAGGEVLVDERDLWPGGQFVTTHLVASTAFLASNPGIARRFLDGHVDAVAFLSADPAARSAVNDALAEVSGRPLAAAVLNRALASLTITTDPIAASLRTSADRALAAGLLKTADLRGIYDLRLLNEVLGARNRPRVDDAGLGRS